MNWARPKAMIEVALKDLIGRAERLKVEIRARVEHSFHVVKNLFGHRKVRYKGLKKNTAHCFCRSWQSGDRPEAAFGRIHPRYARKTGKQPRRRLDCPEGPQN